MASLSSKEIAALKVQVCDLDAKLASLLQDESLGVNVKCEKDLVMQKIQTIGELVSSCEAALRPPVAARPQALRPPVAARPSADVGVGRNPALQFLEDFLVAVQSMISAGVPKRIINHVVSGQYLPVRGDGNCGLRAFLTALAARSGILLPIDPPGMLEWIYRLKPLMIQAMREMLDAGIIEARDLLTIPENRLPADATLDDYFALFLMDGYFITNFDFRVLAYMFNLQINVIREQPNGYDDVQCFVPVGHLPDHRIKEHLCILQQPCHFVPIINFLYTRPAEKCLHNALEMEFTG